MKKLIPLFISLFFISISHISIAQKHSIGEKFGGGIVFYITPDGLHGLVTEIQDVDGPFDWYLAQDVVSIPDYHGFEGKNFTDWRLPTKTELFLLLKQRKVVSGLANAYYWSSTEMDANNAYYISFMNQFRHDDNLKTKLCNVRAVRSF